MRSVEGLCGSSIAAVSDDTLMQETGGRTSDCMNHGSARERLKAGIVCVCAAGTWNEQPRLSGIAHARERETVCHGPCWTGSSSSSHWPPTVAVSQPPNPSGIFQAVLDSQCHHSAHTFVSGDVAMACLKQYPPFNLSHSPLTCHPSEEHSRDGLFVRTPYLFYHSHFPANSTSPHLLPTCPPASFTESVHLRYLPTPHLTPRHLPPWATDK